MIDISAKRKTKPDPELEAMLRFSNYIDSLITEELNLGVVEPRNLLAVLSHRIGTFISAMQCPEEERETLINHTIELILKLSLSRTH